MVERERARQFAVEAHAGQTDKAGRPYVEHLQRVAEALPEHLQAAGWLHDVIEDTPVDAETLHAFPFSPSTLLVS